MTQDYKKNLMAWLTGNFETTPSQEQVLQQGQTISQNILTDYLQANYTTTNCTVIKTVKSVTDGNMLCLLWDRDNSKSIIVIFDESMSPISLLTGYESGTQFTHIMGINVGEDGNYFLIENTGSAIRFVMCNNITAGDINGNYKAVLRKAYNVGGNLINMVVMYEIVKYPNLSKYLVVGADTDMQPTINIATEIVVNVGTANEYNDFTFNIVTTMAPRYADMYYTLDGEDIKFNIYGDSSTFFVVYSNNGYEITDTTYWLDDYGITLPWFVKVVATGLNECYMLAFRTISRDYVVAHRLNDDITVLMEDPGGYAIGFNPATFVNTFPSINKIGGLIYGTYVIEDNGMFRIRVFTVADNVCTANTVSDRYADTMFTDVNLITTASNSYDLYNFVYTFGTLTTNTYLVYNSGRYNGEAYVDYNYFIPSHALLFQRSQTGIIPLFARGLYNFTILNNSSTAVVNVPNQYVNDISWETSLYGETNGELVNRLGVTKNIYENLLINFNNSITITNDDIYMATPSARLNNSILASLDYNQAKMGWVRINFANQTRDLPIELTRITNRRYTIDITLYAGEDINSIQILSEDKQTIYDSFNIDYEIGKTYSVARIVTIGG